MERNIVQDRRTCLVLFLLALIFFGKGDALSGQTIARELISTAGGTENVSIDGKAYIFGWAMGEPMNETYFASKKILTQGFIQGKGFVKDTIGIDTTFVSGNDHLKSLMVEVLFYPNPTRGPLTIKVSPLSDINCEFTLEISDNKGRIVQRKSSIEVPCQQTIDLSSYENGLYFLKMTVRGKMHTDLLNAKIEQARYYKIVKI